MFQGKHNGQLSQPNETPESKNRFSSLVGYDDDIFSVSISCAHETIDENNDLVRYSCESTDFTNLEYSDCALELLYTYTITNKAKEPIRLRTLIDENFNDIAEQSMLIDSGSITTVDQTDFFDICTTRKVEKRVVALADLVQESGSTVSLKPVRDVLHFQTP